MAKVDLSILKITGDTNDYMITDQTARTNATTAQSTATQAQSTAETAQSTAETAQSTATQAQSTATQAQSTAANALEVANSKLLSVRLNSSYTSETKTLTLSLVSSND